MIDKWFQAKGWEPLPFQRAAWQEIRAGHSGLISVPTGAGKTYAAYLPALEEVEGGEGTQILYITPLRALARDLEQALRQPITDLQLALQVEKRTGDTPSHARVKQLKKPPEVLLITPESLAILLSDPLAQERLGHLKTVIVDEWHELLGSKRGVLLELCLARLKKWNSALKIWGISATIGNLKEAAQVCVGLDRQPVLVNFPLDREVILETLLPPTLAGLPWAGQFGLRMLPWVVEKLRLEEPTLIFTNTRAQAERWHQALLEAKPAWKPYLALHHSSIAKEERERIEMGMKSGTLKITVCTSSLDLGIDFAPVARVIQIGSPKSIARLMQRAGRASHQPLTPCRIALVPTHALEVAELKGYRVALAHGVVEARKPHGLCYDVLSQHLLTCAMGGGFLKEEMYAEVKTTAAFKSLTEEDFAACLHFLTYGGKSLAAYPEYKKLHLEEGRYLFSDPKMTRRHRMNIGTITSDPHVRVQLARGKTLGAVEENFIAQLTPGDHFLFGGRLLELIQYRDLVAYVRLGKGETTTAAVWQGGRLPFSAALGSLLRQALAQEGARYQESDFLDQILALQNKLSYVPQEDELLIEVLKSREGWHAFIYPFEGKTIHQGLASLLAFRLAQKNKATFTLSANDYGLEILGHEALSFPKELFSPDHIEQEVDQILNMQELAKGYFRDIARIAGLTFQNFPGHQKSQRQLQVSSALLYAVIAQYDPDNLLLKQARREVREKEFELGRLKKVLLRLSQAQLKIISIPKLTPFSLPLFIERVSGRLSTETLAERIEKIKAAWMKV